MTETAIQKEIMQTARAMGHKCYRINSGRAKTKGGYVHLAEMGTPDLFVIMSGGRSLWVEVKKPGEEPTVVQRLRHRELRNMGHAVTVARSVEDFIEAVREMEV